MQKAKGQQRHLVQLIHNIMWIGGLDGGGGEDREKVVVAATSESAASIVV